MDVFGGIVYIIENAQQFWSELEEIVQIPDDASLEQLDSTLQHFISFCATYHEQYLQTPVQLDHACDLLLQSDLFTFHSERMREKLLEDAEITTDPHAQLILYRLLLTYGRNHPSFLRAQKKWQPLLPLLMDHIRLDFDPDAEDNYGGSMANGSFSKPFMVPIEARLRQLSVGILYEVCRVQKFSLADLEIFDDIFIDHLFDLVEQTRHMHDESLNYSLIKLIVALNEQFMVASLQVQSPTDASSHHRSSPKHLSAEECNRVLRVLMRRLNSSKTFGENMIFMLNRADRTPEDLCMQLLVLKILYLLFTTKGTTEYFYTNDLCVLVDVFLRELVDLDEESESLRHTYLRVLHPLLTRTQLRSVPYKRPQVVHVLESLISHPSIRDINATTKRLVDRCLSGDWCVQLRKTQSPTETSSSLSLERICSPVSEDSGKIAATSKNDYIPSSSPEDLRLKARNRTVKSSRSAENLRASPVKAKSHLPGMVDVNGKPTNNSTINLLGTAGLPASPPASTPTMPYSSAQQRKIRTTATPNTERGLNSSGFGISRTETPPPLPSAKLRNKSPPLIHSEDSRNHHHYSHGRHGSRSESLTAAVDSIVSPTSSHTFGSASSGSLSPSPPGSQKTQRHRTAPPAPPKRRKPPAVPLNHAPSGNGTLTAIASSRSTPSPLSRLPPISPN